MAEIKSHKILKGIKEISAAIGVSERKVAAMIKAGQEDKDRRIPMLPVWNVGGTWFSHIDMLDDYFAQGCAKYRGRVIVLIEEDEAATDAGKLP